MTLSKIDEVVILYNPISTGDGKYNAENLQNRLHQEAPNLRVALKETEYAGHAEVLAGDYTKRKKPVLLVSSSGDGGYHELINGVLANNSKNIITSLLPSGNANDHYHAVGSDSLVEHIIAGAVHYIDILRITITTDDKMQVRFGHSYAGIGISSSVGKELTKEKLNFFNEKWLVLKHLFTFRHVSILVNNRRVRYSSLIFGNVSQMSKVIQLSRESSLTDGRFEVSTIRYESKFHLLAKLFEAVIVGPQESFSKTSFTFRTIRKLHMQIDGEDYVVAAGSTVEVRSIPRTLRIIT